MYRRVFLVLCAFAMFSAEEICRDPNSQFTYCGSPCDETCEGRDEECAEICLQKCECKSGFVLHNSECIRKEDCPTFKCTKPHMEFTDCGTYCPNTCENSVNEGCIDMCFVGCQCKEGYLLHNSNCIKSEECPKIN